MKTNLMSIDNIFGEIKVPSKPHIIDGHKSITKEEIENRMRVAKELENLGISTSKFDIADEHEDTDVLQAIILVNQGKEIPEDLRKRLLSKSNVDFEEERKP